MEKVLVGLSGGADSAAVALLLKEQGYEVFGVHLSFCRGDTPERAKAVAEKLGIPFFAVKRQKRFCNKVITPFVEAYRRGVTPNPCIECNRSMKFACLLEEADRLGIRLVATGHYARIEKGENGRFHLMRGRDVSKDQSYFLRKLTQKQLSRILFPLADEEKSDVKVRVRALLPPEEKESMEICFVPDGDTAAFVAAHGGKTPVGDFVDARGTVLGQHKGIFRYTVGQRRGLGVALGQRTFVTEIRPEENQVVLGTPEELLTDNMYVNDLHFVSCTKKEVGGKKLEFQGRSRNTTCPCKVIFDGKGGATVHFSEPIRRISYGQSACFYEGDTLLFGGILTPLDQKTEEKTALCKV